jgi:hypothetical protein
VFLYKNIQNLQSFTWERIEGLITKGIQKIALC